MGPGAAAPAGVRGGAPAGAGAEPRRGAGCGAKKISEIYRVILAFAVSLSSDELSGSERIL